MEFRILGPLEVDDGDRPLALGGRLQRALLALLLLRANEVVSSERIVDALWGEHPPKTVSTSLQNVVSALRKALGPSSLVTRPPGYVLRVDQEQVDAGRFRRLAEQARTEAPPARAQLLREALALWRGPALADLELDDFVQDDVRHLEELRLVALEERLDADLELGRHAELVPELERLAREHPLRERFRGQLMLALYRAGRQAEALAAYADARRTLVEELGIEPGPALQRLHASILRQERAIDGDRRAAAADSHDHYEEAGRALRTGRLVVVLGAEPDGLAGHLAERFDPPAADRAGLARIAEYVALAHGSGPLYDELHDALGRTVPSAVHRFVARLVPLVRERAAQHPLVVTTCYDLALEQELLAAGEAFDLVTYLASGGSRGRFCHLAPGGPARVIDVPNTYAAELSLERRTVVLRLAGGLDPDPARDWESFVVTEDDFIHYLAERPLAQTIPVGLAATLRRSHLLFLGFDLREWSLRTVLARVWGGEPLRYRSWAVAPAATETDRRSWALRGVELVEAPLEDFLETLGRHAGIADGAVA